MILRMSSPAIGTVASESSVPSPYQCQSYSMKLSLRDFAQSTADKPLSVVYGGRMRYARPDSIQSGRAYRIRPPYTTDSGLSAVDWANTRKLNFIEYDWHWYGDGTDDSDATVPMAGFDIRRIIE